MKMEAILSFETSTVLDVTSQKVVPFIVTSGRASNPIDNNCPPLVNRDYL
jgi:hypothetical protein